MGGSSVCLLSTGLETGLRSKRRYAIVVAFIVAAVLTPPDVVSQLALAVPLIGFYELSIVIGRWIEKRRDLEDKKKEEQENNDDKEKEAGTAAGS